ncbi:MAG: tRNA-dihydrouridine synthase, partial [Nitratireductor sp.]|nr:tRNA-dihydrouridine synthase [Nitratireductor sp.]
WDAVRAVSEAVSVPVVVNGDITDARSAELALERSGADAVMVGRGAYGAPWLPGLISGAMAAETVEDTRFIVHTALEHHRELLKLYGLKPGMRQARKHLAWYLDRIPHGCDAGLRRMILTTEESEVVATAFEAIAASAAMTEAA